MTPLPHTAFRQSAVQRSPVWPLPAPSSHSSRCVPPGDSRLITWSPQRATLHDVAGVVALLRQSSASLALPSSHSSPCSLMPLPQWMVWQVVEHVLVSEPFIAPSSHSSVRALILPSPQVASLHDDGAALLLRQSSPSLWLPSSHSSPGSLMPLPHCWMWQFALQTWPPVTPSDPSHSSPG